MAENLRLLIVDDSKIALVQLQAIIEGIEGAEVVGTAENGVSAIQAAAAHSPDLVLMDIVMPEMDGLAALRLLHAKSPGLRIAMVSSLGGSGRHAEEAFRMGAIQVIGKPFDIEQVASLVGSEIGLRRKACA